MKLKVATTLVLAACWVPPAAARSLEIIKAHGTIGQCVHPKALPFSNRKGEPQGFQIELGEAIAKTIGVELEPIWIVGSNQMRRAGCDIVTDAIAEPGVQDETGLQLSQPYYRTGIVLAVRPDSPITSAKSISVNAKIGVLGSSFASMVFNQRGLATSAFGFEDDMLKALAGHEIDGAAVSRSAAEYFNHTHPDQAVRIVEIDGLTPAFSWNVGIGMVKPDKELRVAIDHALEQLTADGTIKRIYAKYGIALVPPNPVEANHATGDAAHPR